MVRVRGNTTLRLIPPAREQVIVEIGCGSELLVNLASELQLYRRWVIVEPSDAFAGVAREFASHDDRVTVIKDYFEDSAEAVSAACGTTPDVVICSSVLHEVPEPGRVLGVAYGLLREGGRIIANVPNATSLHRQLAVAMELIPAEHELSGRNAALGQRRVFDREGLRRLVQAAGFQVDDAGGYFLKPFTHEQMTQIPFLDPAIIRGLELLGTKLPDLASEIFVVGSRPDESR